MLNIDAQLPAIRDRTYGLAKAADGATSPSALSTAPAGPYATSSYT